MANELTKIELYGANNDGQAVRFTVSAGSNYAKGTLMHLVSGTTPTAVPLNTGAGSTAVAGVLAMDVSGASTATLWTQGRFLATVSGAIVTGDPLMSIGSKNILMAANSLLAGSLGYRPIILGYALKAATDLTTVPIRLDI